MHSSLDFLFVLVLLLSAQLFLLLQQFQISVISQLSQRVGLLPRKPTSNVALDEQSHLFSPLLPHLRVEIGLRENDFVVSMLSKRVKNVPFVDKEAHLFHLGSEFSHHNRRLGLVLVRLDYSLILIRMVVRHLISLGEGMVKIQPSSVISEPSDVGLFANYFLYFHCDDFNLRKLYIG